jgi:DNA polymerase elongation subunit (family B)
MAPRSSKIRSKYANKELKIAYEHKLCNHDYANANEEIKQEDKLQIKQ